MTKPQLEPLSIDIIEMWAGLDETSREMATLSLNFRRVDYAESDVLEDIEERKRHTSEAIQRLVQEKADSAFPDIGVEVRVTNIRKGSVVAIVALLTPGAVYSFFKDYKDFREGVVQFAKDLRKISFELESATRLAFQRVKRRF